MKIPALKIAGIAMVALAPIAVYVALDGVKPPQASRATLSLPAAQTAPTTPKAVAAPAATPPATAHSIAEPALTLAAFEHRLAESERGARAQVLEATLPAMVANNPAQIARFAELQPDPQLRELLVRQIALLWARTDTDDAMAWVRSLPDSPERAATLIDVSLAVAQTDPARAIAMREPDVGNVEPDGVLDSLVQQWAERDFDAALAWTNARPRAGQRDKLLQRLVYVQAANGAPDAAARLVDEAFDDGPLKQEAFAIVAQFSSGLPN